jgi:hypothetical protein
MLAAGLGVLVTTQRTPGIAAVSLAAIAPEILEGLPAPALCARSHLAEVFLGLGGSMCAHGWPWTLGAFDSLATIGFRTGAGSAGDGRHGMFSRSIA